MGFLTTTYRDGFTCLLAPGKPVWKSGLDLLRDIVASGGDDPRIWRVAAKYLINNVPVDEGQAPTQQSDVG